MRTVLITGGAGFIGTNLAHFFLKDNHVIVLDNLSRDHVEDNLAWLKASKYAQNLEFIKADVRDRQALDGVIARAQIIFHEAGQTAVTTSLANPWDDFSINSLGTVTLLESMRQLNPEAILVFASTNKVYGNLESFKLQEGENRYAPQGIQAVTEQQVLDFHSPYGCSKGAADQYVRDYSRSFGLKTVVFRQSCIYGIHQMGVEDQGWVAHFAAQAINKAPITIFGNGKQVRDLLYIGDLVNAYDKAVLKINQTSGEIFNIGGGLTNAHSLIEVLAMLQELLGYPLDITFRPERIGDQRYYVSDTSKASEVFQWQPSTPFNQGLALLLSWLQEYLTKK